MEQVGGGGRKFKAADLNPNLTQIYLENDR